MHEEQDDRLLILDFISGNDGAFHQIFDRYHRSLYLHIIRFVKSPDLAADIVQDVFLKVWEIRSSIRPEHSFRAFLFTIAKHQMLNILKRAAKEQEIRAEIIRHVSSVSSDGEATVEYNEICTITDRAIECLPPQRKIVFKLFKDEGMDYHEIAEHLGVSSNTVRDHISKASTFIRGYLKMNATIVLLLLSGTGTF